MAIGNDRNPISPQYHPPGTAGAGPTQLQPAYTDPSRQFGTPQYAQRINAARQANPYAAAFANQQLQDQLRQRQQWAGAAAAQAILQRKLIDYENNARTKAYAMRVRQELLAKANEFTKSANPNERKAVPLLREYALDPHKHNNYDVIHFAYGAGADKTALGLGYSARGYFGSQAAAEAKAANSAAQGFNGPLGGVATKAFATQGLVPAADKLLSPVTGALAAATRAGLQTGNPLTSAHAFVAGLPGLGFTAGGGSAARRAVEQTNTAAEREQLMKQGQLATVGQLATGHYTKAFEKNYGQYKPYQLPDIPAGRMLLAPLTGGLSLTPLFNPIARRVPILDAHLNPATPIDIATQAAQDPTLYLTEALRPLTVLGDRVAEQAAKTAADAGLSESAQRAASSRALRLFVQTDARGIAAVDRVVRVVQDAQVPERVTRLIPGLSRETAQAAVDAFRAEGEEGARRVLQDAFAKGYWKPEVSLANQAGLKVGATAISAPTKGLAGGRIAGAIRDTVSSWAAARTTTELGTAAVRTGVASEAVNRALEVGLRAGKAGGDVVNAAVAEATSGLSPLERIGRVLAIADESKNDALSTAIEHNFRPLITGKKLLPAAQIEKRLADTERLLAVLDGAAGPDAAAAAERHILTGFTPRPVESGITFAQQASDTVGLKLPSKPVTGAITPEDLRAIDIEGLPDGPLKDSLVSDFDKAMAKTGAKQKAGLAKVQATLEHLYSEPNVLDEAVRLADQQDSRLFQQGALMLPGEATAGPIRRGIGRLASSLYEQVPKTAVELTGSNENLAKSALTDAFDRLAGGLRDLGWDDAARAELVSRAAEVKTVADAKALALQFADTTAERAGVDAGALRDLFERRFSEASSSAHSIGAGGDLIKRPQLPTQTEKTLLLPNPDTLRKGIREELAKGGDAWSKLRVEVSSKTGDVSILGLSKNGQPLTVARGLAAGHRFWKVLIVSNAYMPVIGAVAGFVSGGNIEDRLKRAGIGFGVGLLGPVRYVLRTQLQDRLASYWENGLANRTWARARARAAVESGLIDLPYRATNFLDPAASGARASFTGDVLTTLERDWVVLRPGQTRYVDGWWRIVNFQVHPESDPIADILLRERARQVTAEEADAAIKQALKGEDGQLWLRQLKESGTKNVDQAVAQERQFIEQFVPEDIAAKRVNGTVSREDLKAVAKDARPPLIHAQKSWVIPRNIGEVIPKVNEVTGRLAHNLPHVQGAAKPLANAIYEEEYYRMLRLGANPEKAGRIAEEIATNRANSVMFRADNFSRFSRKLDFVSPFQGHREFTIKVWGRLALENPGRTIRLAEYGARAFNAGKENGIFRKDAYGGWVLSIPGSAPLSRALFHTNADFQASLGGFLIVSEGAFTNEGWRGSGLIPTPSSPYIGAVTKLIATIRPQWFDSNSGEAMPEGLRNILFPYGLKGQLIRNEPNRLWMAMTGTVPPWEFLDRNDQEKELRNWQIEMFRQLRYEHFKRTGDATWEPSAAEVRDATKHFFLTWAIVGSVSPASPHPVLPGQDDFQNAAKAFQKVTGKSPFDDRANFVALYPAFDAYLNSKSEYVGPDTATHWQHSDKENQALEVNLGERRELSLNEFMQTFKDGQRKSQAYREFGDALQVPNSVQREQALYDWRQKYPDVARDQAHSYLAQADLQNILSAYPKGRGQDAAIERWRKTNNISLRKYQQMRAEITGGVFFQTAWRAARQPEDVQADVFRNAGTNPDSKAVANYVATLNPAEQVSFWQWTKNHMNYSRGTDDADAIYKKYEAYAKNISDLYTLYPYLQSPKAKKANVWDEAAQGKMDDVRKQVNAAYAEIDNISSQMQDLASKKSWKAYYALKDKKQALYDHITALNNSIYQTVPELGPYFDDVQAMFDFSEVGNTAKAIDYYNKALQDKEHPPFIPSNEEAHFLSLPSSIQQAYVDTMVRDLMAPPKTAGKRYWSYLTNFQQDLLRKNIEPGVVSDWMSQDAQAGSSNGGRNGTFHKRFRSRFGSSGLAADELGFAFGLLKQYNKRGGIKAPPAYAQYRALPNNPAIKRQFLKDHPEVGNYIKLGPLAQMPPLYSLMVSNIMVKYGKWQGDVMDVNEVTDLAFAREQLQRWSMRPAGATAPANYDTWLNMPSGQDKAAFLQAHPEVEQWIRLGPMANMPQEYRDVVRDIMERYGEWTASQDPLGQTISQYYATPGWAREQYLQDHPELTAYWRTIRTPQEQAIQDLTDQYFSITDPNARRTFLSSYPELQRHLLDSRNARYERFLNQVAQYMGSNPELFTQYLTRQNDILAELLKKFGEAPLVREIQPGLGVRPTQARTRSTESGRNRAA